jgi:hypothetical protein
MCIVCSDSSRVEVDAAIGSGELSLREVSRRFGLSRVSIQRHAKQCLGMKKNLSSEALEKAKATHAALSGDLDSAFESALALKERAEKSGDLAAITKAERHLTRLLVLRQRQAGKLPSSEVTTTTPRVYRGPVRILPPDISDFPDDLKELGERFFGEEAMARSMHSQRDLPEDAPVVRWKIVWRDSPIMNPKTPQTPETDVPE